MKLGASECLWYSNVWIQYMSGETIKIPRHMKKSCYSFIKVKIFKICIRFRKFGVRLDSFRNIYVNS